MFVYEVSKESDMFYVFVHIATASRIEGINYYVRGIDSLL
jgi:hypothetical protein